MNAAIATFFTLLIGYPMALGIARAARRMAQCAAAPGDPAVLDVVPAARLCLDRTSRQQQLVQSRPDLDPGTLSFPFWVQVDHIQMMNTNFAVVLGIVYSYLPFMILPLYATLEKLDHTLNEAAMDLGSRPWQVFKDMTLPLSLPGIIAGALLVFIPATGEHVIPSLMGRADSPMIGRVINDEFFLNRDWPMASAVAVALLVLLVVPIMIYNFFQARSDAAGAR